MTIKVSFCYPSFYYLFTVAAGFAIHKLSTLRSRWTTTNGMEITSSVDQFLHGAFTNPLSLQDLTRIRIRSILRERGVSVDLEDQERTPFERALWRLGLPPRLVRYLYEYSDVDRRWWSHSSS